MYYYTAIKFQTLASFNMNWNWDTVLFFYLLYFMFIVICPDMTENITKIKLLMRFACFSFKDCKLEQ